MSDMYKTPETPVNEPSYSGGNAWKWVLVIALVLALGGNIYLLKRSSNLSDQISEIQAGTDSQLAKINAAADATREESRKQLASLSESLNTFHTASNTAVTRARAEAKKQSDQFGKRLEEQQQAISGEISQVKTTADDANAKINEVSTDVGSVKTDVSGVKTDVNGVKTELTAAQTALTQHENELKRMVGDMGAMSGLIATNSKDLTTLRELGERNYYEFTLSKGKTSTKVGGVLLTLKKADPKNSRFTMEVMADDKKVEKRDRTINEPVQIYVAGSRMPDEIVVNQVKKDQVVGYVSTPKMMVSRVTQ
jgi:chromosome segregation ATPase